MSHTKIIYIAGKVTGLDQAITEQKFAKAQIVLESQGYKVINPIILVNNWNAKWDDAMRQCIVAMCFVNEAYFLSDWKESKGAILEHEIAKNLGMNIQYQS